VAPLAQIASFFSANLNCFFEFIPFDSVARRGDFPLLGSAEKRKQVIIERVEPFGTAIAKISVEAWFISHQGQMDRRSFLIAEIA
jgi:hypothetical protein